MKHKEWYMKEVMPLLSELTIMENRMKNAISYIENLKEPYTGEVYLLDNERTELIDILKGDNDSNVKILNKKL